VWICHKTHCIKEASHPALAGPVHAVGVERGDDRLLGLQRQFVQRSLLAATTFLMAPLELSAWAGPPLLGQFRVVLLAGLVLLLRTPMLGSAATGKDRSRAFGT
jgi:hypothetical protein